MIIKNNVFSDTWAVLKTESLRSLTFLRSYLYVFQLWLSICEDRPSPYGSDRNPCLIFRSRVKGHQSPDSTHASKVSSNRVNLNRLKRKKEKIDIDLSHWLTSSRDQQVSAYHRRPIRSPIITHLFNSINLIIMKLQRLELRRLARGTVLHCRYTPVT